MFHVAVVGATGAVGQELLRVLERREFPVASLKALASARSAGTTLPFRGEQVPVAEATPASFEGTDIAFFSAGATRSRELVPHAREAGAVVVDNSSAYRMAPDVPLVVPEVNPEAMAGEPDLVANPNCVAAILTVALAPLRALAPLERLVVTTFQSASGAGARAMEDLVRQTRDHLEGREVVPRVLPHPYAFNLFSHDSAVEANGNNGEENKVIEETQKIFGLPDLPMSVTCVRVPVLRAHTEVVRVTFAAPVQPSDARRVLANAAGLEVVDDPDGNRFPMPVEATGRDEVLVGRIRQSPTEPHSLDLMICGDQLLKGAALNAVQVAERLKNTTP